MRKCTYFLAAAIVFLLVGLCTDTGYAADDCGNANGDASINVSDAVWIINFVFVGGDPPDPLCVGDANGDFSINVSDAVYIINFVFVGGSAPVINCCTGCPPTVRDIDGNVYQTVLIGEQCWMKENLRVAHYQNGDPISNITDETAWANVAAGTGAYCDYDNDDGNAEIYGRLYNWWAVTDPRNVAPEGWFPATGSDYFTLADYLGGWAVAGGMLKEVGLVHWNEPNDGATNESGFTGLPNGIRSHTGNFNGLGNLAYIWSTSTASMTAYSYRLHYDSPAFDEIDGLGYRAGCAVRCVKYIGGK